MSTYKECSIDRIMYLIDWDRTESEQQEGISMARKVICLKLFFQPYGPGYSESVWDNCAVIICQRSDEELSTYTMDMLLWMKDLNWPGAERIKERLIQLHKVDFLAMNLNDLVPSLEKLEKGDWLRSLSVLLDNSRLTELLEHDTVETLRRFRHRK